MGGVVGGVVVVVGWRRRSWKWRGRWGRRWWWRGGGGGGDGDGGEEVGGMELKPTEWRSLLVYVFRYILPLFT